jgi:hypothetical protein
MPKLIASRSAEEFKTQIRASNIDLSFYIDELQELQTDGKVEGTWELLEEETQRVEKRRFTVAAKQMGLATAWKTAPEGELRLVLAPIGEPLPGSRAWVQRQKAGSTAGGQQKARKQQSLSG